MSRVSFIVETTPTLFPLGTTIPTITRVEILDVSGNVVASQDSGYDYPGIADGDYSVRLTQIGDDGEPFGKPIIKAFSVPNTVTIEVVSGVAITVTPE